MPGGVVGTQHRSALSFGQMCAAGEIVAIVVCSVVFVGAVVALIWWLKKRKTSKETDALSVNMKAQA